MVRLHCTARCQGMLAEAHVELPGRPGQQLQCRLPAQAALCHNWAASSPQQLTHMLQDMPGP
jgi:hypothetical protein